MRTFKLTIAYDGTDFAGWQVQPTRPTIQCTLESALKRIAGEHVGVIGSGRTDAGVHALAQVASCRLAWRHSPCQLAHALNAYLPDSIVVLSVSEVPAQFHPIRDALEKEYWYQVQLGGPRDVFEGRYRWQINAEVDLDRIQQAASRLVGRHDFASFQASGSDRKTTVRELRVCRWESQDDGPCGQQRGKLIVAADGFLYNMVRNIVGTLVEVGRGKYPPGWVDTVLAARDRDAAGPTAPPHGLFLASVKYDQAYCD